MRVLNTLLIVIAIGFVLGCGMLGEKTEENPSKPEAPAAETKSSKPVTGDTVVAKWSQNSFYEGKVTEIDGSKITVAWEDGSSPSKVDDTDVFALPKSDSKPDVAVGDIVLAKTGSGSYWNGAEVTGIDGDAFEVKTVEKGDVSNVPGSKIIKVSDAIAANLKQKAGSTNFLADAQAKKPSAPSGFEAKKGDKVLAEWSTNSWWAGKVDKTAGSKTTVAWEDGSTPSAIDSTKVLPFPTSKDSKMPEADQYLLIKPASGTKWEYAQTVSVSDSGVEVKTVSGSTRTVKSGEFVLLN